MIGAEKVTVQAPAGREVAPSAAQPVTQPLAHRILEWPRPAWLFLALVAVCYANTVIAQAHVLVHQ